MGSRDAEELAAKWDAEERANNVVRARVMAAWVAGWCARHLAKGFFIGLGIWVGFAVVGTNIVCS